MKPDAMRVLLTGATGGIGGEAALLLLRAGARVLLASRRPDALQAQAARLRTASGREDGALRTRAADLCDPAALAALADDAAAWGANVVVHAAGAPAFGALETLDPATLARSLQANLWAPMALTQRLLPHLRRQPRAQVLFVGSVLGRIGLPGFSAYAAGKFGLRGFAEALRRELAGTSVRVQYLGPRSTRTAFNDGAVEAYNRATGTAMDPPRRVAEALLQQLQDGRAERFLGWPEQLGVRLNALAPTLLDASFQRHARAVAVPLSLVERTDP